MIGITSKNNVIVNVSKGFKAVDSAAGTYI